MAIFKKLISPYLLISSLVITPFLLSAQENLDTAVNALTDQINKYMVEQKKTKIAVIPFTDLQKQRIMVLGSYIAEELTTNLFLTGKFKIVERSLLKQVLDELKFGQTGVVDSTSAKQLGKMTGVDALVAGTITDLGSYIAVNCRLIETESGEVFAAAKAKITKDDNITRLLEQETNTLETKKEGDKVAIKAADEPKKIEFRNKNKKISLDEIITSVRIGPISLKSNKLNGYIQYELIDVLISKNQLIFHLIISNHWEEANNISSIVPKQNRLEDPFIVDRNGIKYYANNVEPSFEESNSYVPGICNRMTLSFSISEEIESVDLCIQVSGKPNPVKYVIFKDLLLK